MCLIVITVYLCASDCAEGISTIELDVVSDDAWYLLNNVCEGTDDIESHVSLTVNSAKLANVPFFVQTTLFSILS